MFVLQAIEDAEAIDLGKDALPSYMSDRSMWIFPSGSRPRRWASKLLTFWYYRVSSKSMTTLTNSPIPYESAKGLLAPP